MQTIGFVGGLGVASTLHYYEKLAAAFVARGEQPGLVVSHAEVARVMKLAGESALTELATYLNHHLEALAGGGAGFATIGALTPHICAAELKAIARLPLLDVVDCVNDALAQRNARRVGILGTQFVMRSNMFGRLHDVEIVALSPEQIALVHANYAKVALTGKLDGFDSDGVRAVGQDLAARGADTVLLAGTELSLAFDETSAGFRALDCARVHIDAILERAYGA